VNETQAQANPYPYNECATNVWCNHNVFRYSWFAGYVATTIGLSILGAAAAKAVVQGIKASTVFAKISGALGDLADAAKVAQYVNRLKGIGILNSRILIAAVFTTAFAAAAYVWPEIFGSWFSNYLGGAFVFMSVYSLGPSGTSQDAIKAAGRAIREGAIDGSVEMERRFTAYFDGVMRAYGINPLDGTAGSQRLLRLLEAKTHLKLADRTILNSAALLLGDDSFGWTHIWKKHVTGEIPGGSTFLAAYKVADERTIRRLVEESLRYGLVEQAQGYTDRWIYFYTPYPGRPPMVTIVDGGRIITSYPVMP